MPATRLRLLIAAFVAVITLGAWLLSGGDDATVPNAQSHASSASGKTHRVAHEQDRPKRHRLPLLVGRSVAYAYHRAESVAGGAHFAENPSRCDPPVLKGRVFSQDPRPDAEVGPHRPIRLDTNYTASCGKATGGVPCSPSQIEFSIDVHFVSGRYYKKIEIPGVPMDTDQLSIFARNTGTKPCFLHTTSRVSIQDPATGQALPIDANPSRVALHWRMRPGHHLVGYLEWDSWCYGKTNVSFVFSAPGITPANTETRTPACGYLRERPLLSGTYTYEL